jgi:hypothetical protein
MKHKDVSQDRKKKPAGATRSAGTKELNRKAVDCVPSPDELSKMAYFSYEIASAISVKLIPERSGGTTGQMLHEIHDQRHDSYTHSGLNE